MKILITGASGYVGARLYVDLKKSFEVVGTFHQQKLFPELIQMDVTDEVSVLRAVNDVRPDWIIHVAANASASSCDANPEKAIQLNEGGTKNIVNAANQISTKVIYISSVSAITNGDLYGKTKLDSEGHIRQVEAGWTILQPSLILGYSPNTTNDRSFNRFLKCITEKTPAIYDTSWKFQPTWIGHISGIIKEIIKRDILGQIIPITVPEVKSRFEVASDILEPFGIKVTGEDKHDNSPSIMLTQDKLKELDLPQYSYHEMMKKIIREIQENFEYSKE